MTWKRRKTTSNRGKGKGKARARVDSSSDAEEAGAERRDTEERPLSKESEVLEKSTTSNNKPLAPAAADTNHNEEKEELHRSMNLPLDLWLLVAEHLNPPSLLYLTRTTKTLYKTLMSKEQSKSIWNRSAAVLNLPSFHNADLIGPALISFLYETTCYACGKDGAFGMSYTVLKRWHGDSKSEATDSSPAHGCQDKIMLKKETIKQQIPAIRSEAFECVPAVYSEGWYSSIGKHDLYVVDHLRKMSLELLNTIPASLKEEQESAVRSFVESKQHSVRNTHKDATVLQLWLHKVRVEREGSLRTEISQRSNILSFGFDRYQSIRKVMEAWRHVAELPHAITPKELATLVPTLARAVKAHFDSKVEEEREQKHLAHRLALKPRFDRLVGNLTLFPSFPIFLELHTVQQFWKDGYDWLYGDSRQKLGKKWTRARRSIMRDVDDARRWIKLTLLRIAAIELARIGQPFPRDIRSDLAVTRNSRPPSHFAGISNSKNSTGLDVNDPAEISDSELARLLNLYSMQAFAFPNQDPGDYREILWSKFEEINEETYRGPLFPHFDTYWHQVLLQVLGAVDFEDGSAKLTAKLIEELGPHFFCGVCSNGITDADVGMLASELFEHIRQTHPAESTDTPQSSLVLYNKPAPPVAPIDEAVPVIKETARARRAAARH